MESELKGALEITYCIGLQTFLTIQKSHQEVSYVKQDQSRSIQTYPLVPDLNPQPDLDPSSLRDIKEHHWEPVA